MNVTGKKITVIGLGRSGIAASRLLLSQGAKVSVTEEKEDERRREIARSLEKEGISVELGGHTRKTVEGQAWIVTSPGVPPTSPPLQWAREEKIPILSEIELGYLFCKGKILAVTGSNGKTTTVSLIGKMFEAGEKRAFVCGNIGDPFCEALPSIREDDWVILEVSSFQLEFCQKFRPRIAVILNVLPNHLDRHASFEAYLSAKRRISQSQTKEDFLLLNADDPVARTFGDGNSIPHFYFSRKGKTKGIFLGNNKEAILSLPGKEERICTLEGLRLPGSHNEENALAAILSTFLAGVPPQAIQKALTTFEGLPHRIEFVGEWGGVRFVNDSKSTTISSTLCALETVPGTLLWIAGGREKNEDFGLLRKSPLLKKVRRLYLIGEAKEKIQKALSGEIEIVLSDSLEEAVRRSYQEARSGETVLLSPMCTSFDMFQDFEERGDCFKRNVQGFHAH